MELDLVPTQVLLEALARRYDHLAVMGQGKRTADTSSHLIYFNGENRWILKGLVSQMLHDLTAATAADGSPDT